MIYAGRGARTRIPRYPPRRYSGVESLRPPPPAPPTVLSPLLFRPLPLSPEHLSRRLSGSDDLPTTGICILVKLFTCQSISAPRTHPSCLPPIAHLVLPYPSAPQTRAHTMPSPSPVRPPSVPRSDGFSAGPAGRSEQRRLWRAKSPILVLRVRRANRLAAAATATVTAAADDL